MKKHQLKKNEKEYQYGFQSGKNQYKSSQQKHYPHKRDSEPPSSKTIVSPSVGSSAASSSDDDCINSISINPKVRCHTCLIIPVFLTQSQYFNKLPPDTPKPQQVLIARNKSLNSKPTIASRIKDLRLKGSDLYVARLGAINTTPVKLLSTDQSKTTLLSSSSTPNSSPSSLYDEFSPLSRSAFPAAPNLPSPIQPQYNPDPCLTTLLQMRDSHARSRHQKRLLDKPKRRMGRC